MGSTDPSEMSPRELSLFRADNMILLHSEIRSSTPWVLSSILEVYSSGYNKPVELADPITVLGKNIILRLIVGDEILIRKIPVNGVFHHSDVV